jgi:hypothetical protein
MSAQKHSSATLQQELEKPAKIAIQVGVFG